MKQLPHMDGKILAALMAIIFSFYGAIWSYHALYMKTPDYAFSQLAAAARRGDMAALSQDADINAVFTEFFEAIPSQSPHADSRLLSLPLAWSPFREEFTAAGQQILTGYVVSDTSSTAFSNANEALRKALQALSFPIPAEGWHYQAAHWSKSAGAGKAVLTADFYNESLQAMIPVTFAMERTGTASWRITGLASPTETLAAIRQAYTDQLTKKNESVQKQIDAIVTISDVSAKLLSSSNHAWFLRIQYVPHFSIDLNEMEEIKGTYILTRRSDNAVLYTAAMRISTTPEKNTCTTQFLLNPLIPSQYALSQNTDLSDTDSTIAITSVRLKDGTSYIVSTEIGQTDIPSEK